MISYLSWDCFTISPNLIAHAALEHLDTDIELSLRTIDHFHFPFFACISQADITLEATNIYK